MISASRGLLLVQEKPYLRTFFFYILGDSFAFLLVIIAFWLAPDRQKAETSQVYSPFFGSLPTPRSDSSEFRTGLDPDRFDIHGAKVNHLRSAVIFTPLAWLNIEELGHRDQAIATLF